MEGTEGGALTRRPFKVQGSKFKVRQRVRSEPVFCESENF
jgi:hypothetical protein